MVDIFVAWPMPLIWLMGLGITVWWRNASGTLLAVAAGLLIVSSMPIVGWLLLSPLSYDVTRNVSRLSQVEAVGIFVPTAGSFRDVSGRWWPEEGSFRRYAAALKLGRMLKLPVIVGGGSPLRDQPAEAQTVVDMFVERDVEVIVVGFGRNTAETAIAIARLPKAKEGGLILLTQSHHILRMRAALRRQGLDVVASTTERSLSQRASVDQWTWRDFVPSDDGLDLMGAAVYEYAGLAWYLIGGKVRLRDL